MPGAISWYNDQWFPDFYSIQQLTRVYFFVMKSIINARVSVKNQKFDHRCDIIKRTNFNYLIVINYIYDRLPLTLFYKLCRQNVKQTTMNMAYEGFYTICYRVYMDNTTR